MNVFLLVNYLDNKGQGEIMHVFRAYFIFLARLNVL